MHYRIKTSRKNRQRIYPGRSIAALIWKNREWSKSPTEKNKPGPSLVTEIQTPIEGRNKPGPGSTEKIVRRIAGRESQDPDPVSRSNLPWICRMVGRCNVDLRGMRRRRWKSRGHVVHAIAAAPEEGHINPNCILTVGSTVLLLQNR